MYVSFIWFLLFTYANANRTALLHSTMNKILSNQQVHSVKLIDMQMELESLRFTVNLWCYLNIGFIIITIYASWKTYQCQIKLNEWRL